MPVSMNNPASHHGSYKARRFERQVSLPVLRLHHASINQRLLSSKSGSLDMAPTSWRYFPRAEKSLRLPPTEKSILATTAHHLPTSDSVPPEVESSSYKSNNPINSESLSLRSRIWSLKKRRPLCFRFLIVLAVLIVFSIVIAL